MSDRIHDAFDQIHAEAELKEHTAQFLEQVLSEQKSARSRTKRYISCRRAVAALAVFVLVFTVCGRAYLTPVSAISLEINPCIELGINRFDRVISVDSYNDDGASLALKLPVKNKNYADAVDLILSDETISGLLTTDEQMEVTVVGDDNEKNSQILSRLEECVSHTENISCHTGNSAEAEEAHSHGLSLGKYRAYLELCALDAEIAPEDVRDMTMRQLRDLILSLGDISDATEAPSEEGCDNNSGNGTHNGNGNAHNDNGNGHHGHH